jgi:hypothetical protein
MRERERERERVTFSSSGHTFLSNKDIIHLHAKRSLLFKNNFETFFSKSVINIFLYKFLLQVYVFYDSTNIWRGCRGHDHMVVGFTTDVVSSNFDQGEVYNIMW